MRTVDVGNKQSLRLKGLKGEDLACDYLKNLGYKIIERNYRIRGGEIDIVCREGNILVFVEVKTRNSYEYGLPVESMTPWKIRFLKRCALFYVVQSGWGNGPYRIDFISIDFADSKTHPKIELIKNITQ